MGTGVRHECHDLRTVSGFFSRLRQDHVVSELSELRKLPAVRMPAVRVALRNAGDDIRLNSSAEMTDTSRPHSSASGVDLRLLLQTIQHSRRDGDQLG